MNNLKQKILWLDTHESTITAVISVVAIISFWVLAACVLSLSSLIVLVCAQCVIIGLVAVFMGFVFLWKKLVYWAARTWQTEKKN